MENTSKLPPLSKRDLSYFQRRNKNRIFEKLTAFFAEEAEQRGITKKDISDCIGKDPASLNRLLSAPSNVTADTVSDFLASLGAEMEYRVVRFHEMPKPNFVHPLIEKIISDQKQLHITESKITKSTARYQVVKNSETSTATATIGAS